jgi:hypothetical protein
MTWSDRRHYAREKREFLRSCNKLVADRILSAALILSILGFVGFGLLADARLKKNLAVKGVSLILSADPTTEWSDGHTSRRRRLQDGS